MSQRAKRQLSRADDGPVPTKRRKGRPPAVAEEEDTSSLDPGWTPRPHSDLKMNTIYNRSATEAPAELFRKDLISAMKLPDSEPLAVDEYWVITDQWKQEWERGVQVPVNPDSLPGPSVTFITHAHQSNNRGHQEFKLPKSKYIRITKDETFKTEEHYLSSMPNKAEKACSYDLDNFDIAWLNIQNGERAMMGLQPIREEQLERLMEELEVRCWDKVQTIVKAEEGLGIEFDENVVCDVCRSPDSEEGNEMVFCDCCNICVHQACYGITAIPPGSWLCRTCALGLRPECVLCPNKGGAMKCTRSGQKWAHVSCALWIPEVSIGCVERMEPITKISNIPQSRWALICVLCRERVGACIQCSVKTCKTAYHVTCAFKHGLEMRAIIEDENADDGVKLRSYCQKHSVSSKKEKSGSASEDEDFRRRKRKDMTSEEKNQARAAKLQEIESEFDKHVSPSDLTRQHDVDSEGVVSIYNYWVLKRRSGHNKPLLAPRSEDVDMLTKQQEQADMEKMRMFVQLRQDLERVRNLCYMVSRREKLSRSFFRMREQTFHKQVAVLNDPRNSLSSTEITAVKEANHGPSIYDRLYSHPSAPELSTDFETVLTRIAGIGSPSPEDKGKLDLNGLVRSSKTENPYKRMYINGGVMRRRSVFGGLSSESDTDVKHSLKLDVDSAVSSTDDKLSKPSIKSKSHVSSKEKRFSKKRVVSQMTTDTSSEEENTKPIKSKWQSPRSRSLRQMEKELENKSGGTDDSDDLLSFKNIAKKEPQKVNAIYSDSDTETSIKEEQDEDENTHSDSQQLVMRTKAAMKEFSASQVKGKKGQSKSVKKSDRNNDKEKLDSSLEDDYIRDKENIKSTKKKDKDKDSAASELIVPQRQAAKKATESIRGGTQSKKPEQGEQEVRPALISEDIKTKHKLKSKDIKDNKLKDGKLPNDIYEFDKEGDPEILAYVPQRQAAKKAAEHIKSGMAKPGAENEQDSAKLKQQASPDTGKIRKDVDVPVKKKENENDKVPQRTTPKPLETRSQRATKSSVSSSSSTSSSSGSSRSSSSSSSTDSDESDEKKSFTKLPLAKKSLFDPPTPRSRVSSRDSPEKKSKQPEKKYSRKEELLTMKKEKAPQSSSSSSSSESEENESPKRTTRPQPIHRKSSDSISGRLRSPETKSTENSRKDRDGSSYSKMVAAKKFKKSPDKKLKTSDGRPELEFQQPPIEREEPTRYNKTRREKGRPASSDRLRSTQTRHGDSSSKARSPSVSPKRCSRSRSPDNDDETTRSRKPSTSPWKEQGKLEKRKRKSNESEKLSPHSRSQDRRRALSRSPMQTEDNKEKTKPQHPPVTSRKTDKKVDSKSSEDRKSSPSKRITEPESLTSKLEREIAERKAERETPGKHRETSRKSLDKLFEKRDRLIQSKNCAESSTDRKTKLIDNKLDDKKHNEILKSEKHKSHSEKDNDIKAVKSSPVPESDRRERDKSTDSKRTDRNNVPLTEKHNQESRTYQDDNHLISKQINSKHTSESQVDEDKHKKARLTPKSKKKEYGKENELGENVEEKNDAENERESKDHIGDSSLAPLSPLNLPQESNNRNLELPQLDRKEPEIELEKKNIRTAYQHRSIFSPPPPPSHKEPGDSELFGDFESDILNVDDNDDGFHIARDSEEMRAPPLSLSFGNEFLFKEDSKEDSARETLNLVEKLRLEYAKKSTHQPDANDIVPDAHSESDIDPTSVAFKEDCKEEEVEKGEKEEENEVPQQEELQESVATPQRPPSPPPHSPPQMPPSESSPHLVSPVLDTVKPIENSEVSSVGVIKPTIEEPSPLSLSDHSVIHPEEKHEEPTPYTGNEPYMYQPCSMNVEMSKLPGREDIDRSNSAQADERWVPPSVSHYDPSPSPYTEINERNKWADSEVLPSRRTSSSSGSSTSSSCHREDIEPKRDDILLPPPTSLMPDLVSFPGMHPNLPPYSACAMPDGPPYHPYSEASPFVAPVLFPPQCNQMPFPSPGGIFPGYSNPFPGPPHSLMKPTEEPLLIPPSCTAAFTTSSVNMALTAAMVSPNSVLQQEQQPLTPASCVHASTSEPSIVESYNHQPPPTPQQTQIQPPPDSTLQSQPQTTVPTSLPTPTQTSTGVETPLQPPQEDTEPAPPQRTPKQNLNSSGKKSPAKPTRTSARFLSQQKSPAKSPGKSPRQMETVNRGRVRDTTNKRGPKGRGGPGSRGRGRGRGRGRPPIHHYHMDDRDTIQSKLVGTVYDFDFDDEGSERVENLRAMRERRRSTDIHERKSSDSSFLSRDSSQSPKFSSPVHNSKARSSYAADVRDLKPPTPVENVDEYESRPVENFPDVVGPMLPGPVDMRTYSSYEPSSNTGFHNDLISGFPTSSATDHPVSDIVEDLEKELQSYSKNKTAEIETLAKREEPVVQESVDNASVNKVSLSDSRNQLKVKIKGPFLDANYVTSTTVPQVQPPIPPIDAAITVSATSAVSVSSGTSNLRRMRKKELLRQYWNQDMNMDEPVSSVVPGQANIPTSTPPVNRTVITIPKAVASMTSIPTREDYKAVVDANMEKKRRKDKVFNNTETDAVESETPERRRSTTSNELNQPLKRRGRSPRVAAQQPPAPKLKIKIGSESQASVTTVSDERKNLRIRPPKKRLSTMPSFEELKRQSMKFRKMVMADFNEEEKQKSLDMPTPRRKKKEDKREKVEKSETSDETHVQVIGNETTPKLIIRFKRSENTPAPPPQAASSAPSPSSVDNGLSEEAVKRTSESGKVNEVRTSKTAPIRLKLSRCEEGYMMKEPMSCAEEVPTKDVSTLRGDATNPIPPPSSSPAPPPQAVAAPPQPQQSTAKERTVTTSPPPPSPPPLSKDCEVR